MFLGVLAGRAKLRVIRFSGARDSGLMSLGFPVIFVALLLLGPSAAVAVGLSSTLSSCLLPKRQPPHQVAFNVALDALAAYAAGLAFFDFNGLRLDLAPLRSFASVMLACLTFFLIDTGAVATVIALCAGESPGRLWQERCVWTAPSYFASAAVAALAIVIFGRHLGVVLLFVTPVALLTYQAYALYTTHAEERQRRLEENQRHITALEAGQAQLSDLYLATIKSLALAIDAKDQYTHQHILRVQRLAMATAQALGLAGGELEGLRTGALLHDIGKLGVPDYILLKPGRLTGEEFEKIKKHPEIGAAILDPVEFPWPVLPVVKHHHEKWDGTGYPEGLAGEEIPLTARVLAVADVYDALTSNRSYRAAWTPAEALDTIRAGAGTHFDPRVVAAFLSVVEPVSREIGHEESAPTAAPSVLSRPRQGKTQEAAHQIFRASSELLALYEVAQTVGSSFGLDETLDILARKLEAILPGTACLLLLRAEDPNVLTVRAAVGTNREWFAGAHTQGPHSRSGRAAREQRSDLGPYDPGDLRLTREPATEWTALRSALITPLIHQGEVLGTINVYHPEPEAFGAEERGLLEMIADRAARALHGAQQFDRTRSSALTDPLTGLYNTRFLMPHLEERCRPGNTPGALRRTDAFALLCLDLDSFKPINDLFGHQHGDRVLTDLARIFRECVRRDDIVTRYGGDEFLIVLGGVSAGEAEAVAAKIEGAVARYDPDLVHPALGAVRLGVSVGTSLFPTDGTSGSTLLSVADARMYRRKSERRLRQLTGGQPTPPPAATSPPVPGAAATRADLS